MRMRFWLGRREIYVILVIANTSLFAGGNPYQMPLATVTTYNDLSNSWIARALHELGHAAFDLADEYEYWLGCDQSEPDHYHYTGPEPVEPNITANGDLATIKWASLVNPAATLVLNLNCSKCNPETSPLPLWVIGAFEGAGYFHGGLYRPKFVCRMRDNQVSFCPVCWAWIRSVLLPQSCFQTWPQEAEVDVEPWPTTLRWTHGKWESKWQVQVTDGPDFSSGQVQVLYTTKTHVIN
jgi:hypothetical protein